MIATLLGTAAVVIGVHAASLERFLRRSERFDTADRTLLKRAWASSFVVAAWVAWLTGRGAAGRSLLLVAMVTVAGSRWLLQSVMTRRSTLRAPFVRPPQPNQSFRRRVDVLRVFAVQAGVVWLVGLPVALAMADATPPALTVLSVAGVALWAVGVTVAALGDWQLASFAADPSNHGLVMDEGLWRFSRHPHYFGECCLWWGISLVAAETGSAAVGLVGPLLLTVLAVRKARDLTIESSIVRRRPAYADYVRTTNAFFLWSSGRRYD